MSPTPEQLAKSRHFFVAGCVIIALNISSIVTGSVVMFYRFQTSRFLSEAADAFRLNPAARYASTWSDSARNAEFASAFQILVEVLSLFIKAVAFVFICRLDLRRLEKAKRLLSVRAWCMSCSCRDGQVHHIQTQPSHQLSPTGKRRYLS